jgi:elongation factor Ts
VSFEPTAAGRRRLNAALGLMTNCSKFLESYVHNGSIGVLIEIECESSFAQQTAEFKELAKGLAMHVASASPASVEQLLQQHFVKDPTVTVARLLLDTSTRLKERITVTRFVRWGKVLATSPSTEPPHPPAAVIPFRGSP